MHVCGWVVGGTLSVTIETVAVPNLYGRAGPWGTLYSVTLGPSPRLLGCEPFRVRTFQDANLLQSTGSRIYVERPRRCSRYGAVYMGTGERAAVRLEQGRAGFKLPGVGKYLLI